MSNQGASLSGSLSSPLSDGYLVTLNTSPQTINLTAGTPPIGPASSVEIRNVSVYAVRATFNTTSGGGALAGSASVLIPKGGTYTVSYETNLIDDLTLDLVNVPPPTTAGITSIASLTPLPSGNSGQVIVTFA